MSVGIRIFTTFAELAPLESRARRVLRFWGSLGLPDAADVRFSGQHDGKGVEAVIQAVGERPAFDVREHGSGGCGDDPCAAARIVDPVEQLLLMVGRQPRDIVEDEAPDRRAREFGGGSVAVDDGRVERLDQRIEKHADGRIGTDQQQIRRSKG